MFPNHLKVLALLLAVVCLTPISAKRRHGRIRHRSSAVAKYRSYPLFDLDARYGGFDDDVEPRDGPIDAKGCEMEDRRYRDYEKCGTYHFCKRIGRDEDGRFIWERHTQECGRGQSFDEETESCVDIPCSALEPWPEAPSHFNCSRNYHKAQHPQNCKKFYICHWTGSYYTIEVVTCNGGVYFFESTKSCHWADKCPNGKEINPNEPQPDTQGWCEKRNSASPHPEDCSKWLWCTKERGKCDKYCYKVHSCHAGKVYNKNPKKPGCVHGVCANSKREFPLPPGWSCDGDGALHVNPTNCNQYYKCVTCKDKKLGTNKCRENFQDCPGGQYFDDTMKQCVNTPKCPQDLKELPSGPGWHCDREGEKNVHPKDCTKYYTCLKCSKPSGWCYDATQCPSGKFFDDSSKKCVVSQVCPQGLAELPINWECERASEQNVVPEDCTDYFVCIPCDKPRRWCYTRHTCPDGETFDDERMQCVRGRCPQWPDQLPDNWKCDKDSELNVDPTDCTKFYKCVGCPPGDNHQWCYLPESCTSGQWFDDRQKKCVKHIKCPQEDKELPDGDGWICESVGDTHVVPHDCRKFYQCYRCSMPKGWCYEDVLCPSGKTFDEILGECVRGKCPQDKKELPPGPGWHCNVQGESNVLPSDCSKFYVCDKCSKPGGWCYEDHACPAGQTFDDKIKKCVVGRCPQDPVPIPDNFKCTKDGEMHVHPDDCSRYYKCVWTGSYYSWTDHQCPNGKNFDEIAKKCVSGPCPQLLIEVGSGNEWKCHHEGEVNVFPGDCSKFFACIKCSKPRGWCYLNAESCPRGHTFDQTKKECVAGVCPQDRPEILEGWSCAQEGQIQVHPDDCKKFIICHRCNKPRGWCYEQHGCPSGQTFDNARLKCVPGRCPQLPLKLPPGWKCNDERERNVVPNDCSSFYTCFACDDGPWCYDGVENCPPGQTYHDKDKECVPGRCPQYPEILPPKWSCGAEGELNVNPSDCTSYFKCIACPDVDKWCYTPHPCPSGQTFDDVNKRCVHGRCPQHPLPLPTGWTCNVDGEFNVDPTDCSKYYRCLGRCPDATWCYIPHVCPSGSSFDDKSKNCMKGGCPQNRKPLPSDWVCEAPMDSHAIPTDCTSYYVCYRCSKGKKWCYESIPCPSGYGFDEDQKTCVEGDCNRPIIPPGGSGQCRTIGHIGNKWPDPSNCQCYHWCRWVIGTTIDVQHACCRKGQHYYDSQKSCRWGECTSGRSANVYSPYDFDDDY